jgi:outer membrane protein OmpA-like peptidoglycan-associated protein
MVGCAVNPSTGKSEITMPDGIKKTFANDDPCANSARNTGIAVGAVAGAVLGNQLGNSKDAKFIGAALGALAGGLIGSDIDDRRCALSKIAKNNALTLSSATITQDKLDQKMDGKSSSIGLDIAVQEGNEFIPETSNLTPAAQKAYGEIADQYKPVVVAENASAEMVAASNASKARKLLIVGHADESGDSAKAAKLSEARAKAVAHVFASHGVPSSNIYYQGAGNTLPVASNATEKGSALNRRVQIVDVPTEKELQQYLSLRNSDPRDFASANIQDVPTAVYNSAPVLVKAHKTSVRPERLVNAHDKHPLRTSSDVTQVDPHEIASTAGAYNFGGKPDEGNKIISLGDPVGRSMFNVISNANADPLTIGSCRKDQPHIATSVKNLESGKELAVRDALPGLYGAPITGTINGNYVAILNPYAPKDAGMPVPYPTFEVYQDYSTKHGRTPTFSKQVPVNVYRGSNATLYRMFVGGPLACMDLVVPIKPVANKGDLYYRHGGQVYVAQGEFVASK